MKQPLVLHAPALSPGEPADLLPQIERICCLLEGIDPDEMNGIPLDVPSEFPAIFHLVSRLNILLDLFKQRIFSFHDSSMELALGISEIFFVLSQVRGGDFQAAVSHQVLESPEEIISNLGLSLNQTIGEIHSQVETIKKMNEELTAWRESLELKVTERTKELHESNAQLAQAHQQLKDNIEKMVIAEKMASIGRLTAGIAHEINSPLSAARSSLSEILVLIDELNASIGDPEVTPDDFREICRELRAAAHLTISATEKTTAFVQSIRTPVRELQPHQLILFDLKKVIQETLMLLQHQLRRSNCAVEIIERHGTLMTRGSPGHFAQVITNLVTNALDAMAHSSSARIVIELSLSPPDVLVSIADSGSGIEPEILPKIFDPLFSTKRFGEGTGLGLSIVHKLVTEQLKGSIEVKTTPGIGTMFLLRLPSAEESNGA